MLDRALNKVLLPLKDRGDDFMNKYKKDILNHLLHSIEFVTSLERLSEREWRRKIGEGKWTIAEIVGHFEPWDQFVIKYRLPYIFSDVELPKGPETDKTNSESASISRKENKQETINRFISTRKALYQAILNIPDDNWEKSFTIGKTKLFLYEYLNGLAEHDHHHFEQIKNTLSD